MLKNNTERQLPNSLLLSRRENKLIIELNRPEKRNALNEATIEGLEQVFSNVPDDIHAIVLHGAGPHFCAGLDLSEIGGRDVTTGVQHSRMWHRTFDAIQFGPVPVVAALHGGVMGGGLELASAAHIRVADPSTYYALPEGQRGIFVGGGGSVRISQLIGVAGMTDMMLTGHVIDADRGFQMGFSQYLVSAGEGFDKALELADKIGNNARMTNFAVTQVLPRIAELGRDQGLMMEALIASIAQNTPEAKTRLQQFLDKKAGKVEKEK